MFIPTGRYIKVVQVPRPGNLPYCTCVLIDDQTVFCWTAAAV
ncbi:hypothetical protein ASZ90_017248 [hydrocarbon metagenome]|uniref:Uncharacterized protein n=1 Tax=hydrocarbon metagenome TaxID=938273 RepID=A0A0W8EA01_9ZZZZ